MGRMNERIKQLWEQAAKTTQGDSWEEQTKFMEKFAELIVKECTDIANGTRYDGKVVANRIKFVFGVEE
jgi:hypothetical protein